MCSIGFKLAEPAYCIDDIRACLCPEDATQLSHELVHYLYAIYLLSITTAMFHQMMDQC